MFHFIYVYAQKLLTIKNLTERLPVTASFFNCYHMPLPTGFSQEDIAESQYP
jgi:hypothetical protein